MFKIHVEEIFEPIDAKPFQLILKISFVDERLKTKLENKYIPKEYYSHSGFILNFYPFFYIGGKLFSNNSFFDFHEAFSKEGSVIKFEKEKQLIKYKKIIMDKLTTFLTKEEKELSSLLNR